MRLEGDRVGAMLGVELVPETPPPVRQTLPMLCGDGARHGLGGRRQSRWLRTADGFAVFERGVDQYKISKIKL
jgi:hypothetical protein